MTDTRELRPDISSSRFDERLASVAEVATEHGVDAVLVGVGADLQYLTGYAPPPLERLTMLVLQPNVDPWIIVPRLEVPAAEARLRTDMRIVGWDDTDNPHGLVIAAVTGVRIAVSDGLPARHLLRLQAAAPRAVFQVATPVLRELRMIKDADEVTLLRLAAEAADRVVAQIAAGRLIGRTEADVAREVRDRLVAEGHDEAKFAIVASGPNSASPHHEAEDRVIGAGEPIVLDIGGTVGGYASDITRMVWVTGGDPAGGPDERYRNLFSVLYGAQERATRAVRPGLPCAEIDAAARLPIETAGYGANFVHRTGHGIGLEVHEDPYLVAGNELELRAGMAFSVEPGIYLPGVYGARIEDIVVCGADGPIPLNTAPRELAVVDG